MSASAEYCASPPLPEVAGASDFRWRRAFPGDERQLRVLRRWVESLLPACAARDDVVAVAVEVATNAIKFTGSGRGGFFTLEIGWYPRMVRVAVSDGGAPTGPRLIEDTMSDHGRGLLMVHALSARRGVVGDERGRLVWAEIAWTGEHAAGPGSVPGGYEAAIRNDQTSLARRFPGVPIWFGRATLQWWALPNWAAGRLLSAPSARELGRLLRRARGRGRLPPRGTGKREAARACDRVSLPASVSSRRRAAVPGVSRLGVMSC